MEDVLNFRVKKIFSGNNIADYPADVPAGETHRIYRDTIREFCLQAKTEISVLHLGCGNGRYFRFLSNVNDLTGVDISEDMLSMAKENLKKIPLLQPATRLILSSIEDYKPSQKFDFIYSIGTLGEYCSFSAQLFGRIISWLKPGGFLFFTLVDAESFNPKEEYVWPRKRLKRFLLRFLPEKIRHKLDADSLVYADWKNNFLSAKQAENIFSSSKAPLRWEIYKAKDNVHTHHICKVWLKNEVV